MRVERVFRWSFAIEPSAKCETIKIGTQNGTTHLHRYQSTENKKKNKTNKYVIADEYLHKMSDTVRHCMVHGLLNKNSLRLQKTPSNFRFSLRERERKIGF